MDYLMLSKKRSLDLGCNKIVKNSDYKFPCKVCIPYFLSSIETEISAYNSMQYSFDIKISFNNIKFKYMAWNIIILSILNNQYYIKYKVSKDVWYVEFYDDAYLNKLNTIKIISSCDKPFSKVTSLGQIKRSIGYLCYGLTNKRYDVFYETLNLGKHFCYLLGLVIIVLDDDYNAIAFCIAKKYSNQEMLVSSIVASNNSRFLKVKMIRE